MDNISIATCRSIRLSATLVQVWYNSRMVFEFEKWDLAVHVAEGVDCAMHV